MELSQEDKALPTRQISYCWQNTAVIQSVFQKNVLLKAYYEYKYSIKTVEVECRYAILCRRYFNISLQYLQIIVLNYTLNIENIWLWKIKYIYLEEIVSYVNIFIEFHKIQWISKKFAKMYFAKINCI